MEGYKLFDWRAVVLDRFLFSSTLDYGVALSALLFQKLLTLPTAKAGGFLLQPSLPTIDRSYTMSTSVGITPSFRVPHGTYV